MKDKLEKSRNVPYLLLVVATFFWGTNFVISRILVNDIPPVHLSLIRWLIAGIVLFPFMLGELRQNKRLIRRNWKVLSLMALTGVAGFNTLLYIAVQYTTSINASLVNSTGPLFMVLLSVLFLKETLQKIQYIGVVVSFIGVLIILTGGEVETLWTMTFNPGDLLVLVAILLFSIYSILMRKFGIALPMKTTFFVTIWMAVLFLIPFTFLEQSVTLSELSVKTILSVVYLSIFPSIVSFICWNEGVMRIGPANASNYLHLIVFFTGVLAVVFGIEKLIWTQLVGGVFIFGGVITTSNPGFIQKRRDRR